MTNELILTMVKAAVLESLTEFEAAYPQEVLCGYALCTDDGVCTLSCRAVTLQALQRITDADFIFCPTDWPYGSQCQAFRDIERELQHRASVAESFRDHIDSMFGTLIESLSSLRSDGYFHSSVFLSVLSTDPSAHSEELESRSIAMLNEDAMIQSRQMFIDKWKQN